MDRYQPHFITCSPIYTNTQLDDEYQPFCKRKAELSVLDGCVLWGSRVVVPPPGRQSVLEELHDTHLGASKMKSLARAYIWWPKMDNDIENLAKSCPTCQQTSAHPRKAPLHPWEWPSQPWSRLHVLSTSGRTLKVARCADNAINNI